VKLSEITESVTDIEQIVPDAKDLERAEGLSMRGPTFHGNNAPFQSEAVKMSKLIKDKTKLIRRAKAVAATWGTKPIRNGKGESQDVWGPFAYALEKAGLTAQEIDAISKYKAK